LPLKRAPNQWRLLDVPTEHQDQSETLGQNLQAGCAQRCAEDQANELKVGTGAIVFMTKPFAAKKFLSVI
jgi:hypothetical protein